MDSTFFKTGLRFYQSANADAQSIKDNFIIRNHEYDIIMDDMRRNGSSKSVQHYLLLGRRGSGKSTLLKRIQVEIDCNKQLKEEYIAINLAEEQANIYRLFDLLEDIYEELQHKDITVDEVNPVNDPHEYARQLFAVLHTAISASGKKLVLLLDNIDRIFENLGKDANLLRENLLNYSDIKIIGGSTRMTEHFWKYDMPFYNFFRVLKLEPLTREEVKQLMLHWSDKQNLPALKEFIENRPGQLETVRILTDGLPRTLQFFVNLIINKGDATGYEYLRQIVDYMTPQYQERLNILPPAQRKIVLQLAFIWESAGAKELAEATRMENKVISAQLKQLADKGLVDKQETNTKNHLYRLSERFFNLWLIFTQGSPHEKRRARYLTVFLENFYSEDELRKMAEEHLHCLYEGKIPADKAAILTKAYAQSKFITIKMRDELIKQTLQLTDINNELRSQLPSEASIVRKEVNELINNRQWNSALKKAQEIEQEDVGKKSILGFLYSKKGDFLNAEKYYLQSLEKLHDPKIMNNLAIIYANQGKYELSEKYYLQSLETSYNPNVVINLSRLYTDQEKYELAENNYWTLIKDNNAEAMQHLAILYLAQNKNKKEALSLLNKSITLKNIEYTPGIIATIKAWNGIFEGIIEDLEILLKNGSQNEIARALKYLLAFNQTALVNNLFTSSPTGQNLKDHLLPLYYVTKILTGNDPNLELKVPPELTNIILGLIYEIEALQKYYAKEPAL